MKIIREVNDFEKVDPRDRFNYQNYYALLACILNENLDASNAISSIMGSCQKGVGAIRRENEKGTKN